MAESNHKLKPDKTVQKILISTTSRMTGEYESEELVITHALPSIYDSSATARMLETPLSRSGFMITFKIPSEERPSIIVPNYTPIGENICAYLSVLFGKRFDCHGLMEANGSYQIPDLTAYSRICDPELPCNSHEKRSCFPVPLEISQISSIERVFFTDSTIDETLRSKLDATCKFYMQALQNAEHDPEVAYLHLITAGEIISSFFEYSKEEVLDRTTIADLDMIRNKIENGDKIARRGVCAVAIFRVEVSGTKAAAARIPAIPKPYYPIQTECADDFPQNRQSRPTADAPAPSGSASV